MNLAGSRIGLLTPLERRPWKGKRPAAWRCLCDPALGGCGTLLLVGEPTLRRCIERGVGTSCGCLARSIARARGLELRAVHLPGQEAGDVAALRLHDAIVLACRKAAPTCAPVAMMPLIQSLGIGVSLSVLYRAFVRIFRATPLDVLRRVSGANAVCRFCRRAGPSSWCLWCSEDIRSERARRRAAGQCTEPGCGAKPTPGARKCTLHAKQRRSRYIRRREVDLATGRHQVKTHRACGNCGERGHYAPTCPGRAA